MKKFFAKFLKIKTSAPKNTKNSDDDLPVTPPSDSINQSSLQSYIVSNEPDSHTEPVHQIARTLKKSKSYLQRRLTHKKIEKRNKHKSTIGLTPIQPLRTKLVTPQNKTSSPQRIFTKKDIKQVFEEFEKRISMEALSDYSISKIKPSSSPIKRALKMGNLENMFRGSGLNNQFFAACFTGDEDSVREMLKRKLVKVNYTNQQHHGAAALHAAVAQNHVDIIKILIENGADVNQLDSVRRTPLHIAASLGYDEAASLLLAKGAEVNVKDEFGFSPLYLALSAHRFEVVGTLLLYDADINAKKNGATILHEMMARGDKDALLYLTNLKDVQLLWNARDDAGDTPLLKAAANNQVEAINLVLEKKGEVIDMGVRNTTGKNIFHIAAMHGSVNILKMLSRREFSIPITQFLNDQDSRLKYTPLHYAAKRGHIECIKQFLKMDVKFDVQDANGNTPLHIALKNGNLEIAQMLKSAGARIDIKNSDGETSKKLLKKMKIDLKH